MSSENLSIVSALYGAAGWGAAAAFIRGTQDNLFSHLTPRSRTATLFAA